MSENLSSLSILLFTIAGLFTILWWILRNWMSGVDKKLENIRDKEQHCRDELGDKYLKRTEWDNFQNKYNKDTEKIRDKQENLMVKVSSQEQISNERYASFWDKANRLRDLIIGLVQELVLRPKSPEEARDYAQKVNSQLISLFKDGPGK